MVENNMYNVEDFYKNGYFIVDDFLEESYHKKLLNRFKEESEWTRIDQVKDHYKKGGPFEMNSKYFPNRDETYYLQGWRAKKLEEDAAWRKDYHDVFLSKISKLFKNEIKNDTTYILKYMKDDFSRIHVDDLRGDVDRVDISILYYLCDEWIWDWGGILMLAESTMSEEMHAIMPKNNRIVFLNNQKKLPHCVTPVTKYAKKDRFVIASFIGCTKSF